MQELEERILRDGQVLSGDILKVDSFLNHQIDYALLKKMGKRFYELYQQCGITKILTVEASGIAIACAAAEYFRVPVLFAKKGSHKNIGTDVYTAEVFSFTKGVNYEIMISKKYISPDDNFFIVDDFMANGQAVLGLKKIIDEAGARLSGVGIAIEKGFQPGGALIRSKGIKVTSLAVIDSMENDKIVFGNADF